MKILIIEDEHKIANSIKKGLMQEGYIADTAYEGEQGLDLGLTSEYDLIILDLMLPKLDGVTICKNLRKADIHTPILMLTAKGEIGDRVNGLDSGADDYLVKPFAFEELLARIKALIRRPKLIKNPKITSGNIEIDTNLFEVKVDQKEVALSRKEFSLLEYLMRNRGKILSKENIINHVWSYDSDIMPNNIEVFIGYIRKKIGKKVIKTVRGFGYKID